MRIALLSFDMALSRPQVDKLKTDAQAQLGRDYLVVALPRGVSMTFLDAPGEYMTREANALRAFAREGDVLAVAVEGKVEENEVVRRPRHEQILRAEPGPA